MAGPPERLPTTKRLEPSCERALKTEPILDRYKRNPQLHEYLAAFNSAEAFQALGHEFIDRRITPEIRAAGKVNILYPGGGHHLAPLETAFVILNQVKEVQEVALTYTEIDWKNAEKLSASLLILHELGLFNSFDRKTLPKRKRGQKGKEELFTLGFVDQCGTKKTVTIRFAYCMSGEKWYRDDYFKESDIFVCHDPGEGDHGVGNMFDRFIYD